MLKTLLNDLYLADDFLEHKYHLEEDLNFNELRKKLNVSDKQLHKILNIRADILNLINTLNNNNIK